MNAFTIDTIYSPLFLTGLAASGAILAVIRHQEAAAEKAQLVTSTDPVTGITLYPRPNRVRVGVTPVLVFGKPNTGRFFSPTFLLCEVLTRQPLALLPFVASWLCFVADVTPWSGYLLGFGLVWRGVVDWSSLPKYWPTEERNRTVLLKLVWCAATGMWIASLVIFAWALILALFLVFALLAGGRSAKRR
jgi:hypothetical protein